MRHMRSAPAYLHHTIDGRVRIKVPAIKGSPIKAAELANKLRYLSTGIDEVTVNPTTGSALIQYDPRRVGQNEILHSLGQLGYQLQLSHGSSAHNEKEMAFTFQELGKNLARTVLHSTMEFALQRLVFALI